jgi:hypothetical protein
VTGKTWPDRVAEAAAPERSGPHAALQHKGSTLCLDVYCECGVHSHLDDDFCYQVECPACGRIWHVSSYVRLVLVEGDEIANAMEPRRPWTHDAPPAQRGTA